MSQERASLSLYFANLLEMEGCTLFKGGRDVTEPLAFVRLIKATPFEEVYINVLGLYSAGITLNKRFKIKQ